MWCVACLGLLTVVLGAVLALTAVVEARHRAAGAADLAALAAADRAWHGPEHACERARLVAEAGGTRLVRCGVGPGLHGDDPPDALVADLTVESRAGPHRLRARARATTG
ncbi:flp pilus-assembly TadE/G-like family protein [Streptomyces sp. ST2-7A]|nr:Rv3654c family TadE-like protein [Streptomyces sp. ST2-7A]MCE7080086.1 flp pilus-assembly TadE/G-like family protein [Streptomyces sp. ST2-7A]